MGQKKPTQHGATDRRLTPSIIAAMRPGEELADPDAPGLRVRCNASGQKTFFYRYRIESGQLRQIRIGHFGAMTLKEARLEHAELKLQRHRGIDPQEERKQARARASEESRARKSGAYSVADLVEDYAREVLANHKRGAESERLLLRNFLPTQGRRPAIAVTKAELLHDVIRPTMQRAPRVATMLLSRIRCAYAHAMEQGRIPEDFTPPTAGIKGAKQVRRKVALSPAELATFLRWLPHSPYSRMVRDALRLTLLTACRSGEVVAARWSDIDLDRGIWTIRETKNSQPHDVMLSRQAVDLLGYRKGIDAQFVFPSPTRATHVQQKALGLATYNARQSKEGSGPADPITTAWTVHDLRRSAATGLARLGCPRVIQDRILNHVDTSIAAIYDTHRYDQEAKDWLQRWANYLDELTVGKPA